MQTMLPPASLPRTPGCNAPERALPHAPGLTTTAQIARWFSACQAEQATSAQTPAAARATFPQRHTTPQVQPLRTPAQWHTKKTSPPQATALGAQTNPSPKDTLWANDQPAQRAPQAVDADKAVQPAQHTAHLAPTSDTAAPAPHKQTASAQTSTELVQMLQDFCVQLYAAPSTTGVHQGHLMLDISTLVPGAMIEMARNGAFMQVRLHAATTNALKLLSREKLRLLKLLQAATSLHVRIEVTVNLPEASE